MVMNKELPLRHVADVKGVVLKKLRARAGVAGPIIYVAAADAGLE